MMERNVYEIYEMFAHLSLEQKKGVLRDFQEMVDAEESRPEESYLEQKWKDIEDLLYDLSREPYIDDQLEIDVIWNICEELIKGGHLRKEEWNPRSAAGQGREAENCGDHVERFRLHEKRRRETVPGAWRGGKVHPVPGNPSGR